MSQCDRQTAIARAAATYPYFYKLQFDVLTGIRQYAEQRVGVQREFFLTEMIGNFDESELTTLARPNFNSYTGYNESIYRYIPGQGLQNQFLVSTSPANALSPGNIGDRQQFEFPPFNVKANDFIYGRVDFSGSGIAPAADATIYTGYKGYSVLDEPYITTDRQTDQIKNSLSAPIDWQWFNFEVADPGANSQRTIHIVENDMYPRLIVGMARLDHGFGLPLFNFVDIYDVSRRLRLTDTHIPLEFLAPSMVYPLRDSEYYQTPCYYFPVEYYFEPYAKIQIDVIAERTNPAIASTTTVSFLTRTI